MESPLNGITVLDWTHGAMGPFCTQMLGDMGADVIKIERVDQGDLWRLGGIHFPNGGDGIFFLAVNRNKRSLSIDVKTPEGKEIIGKLVAKSDVVVESRRPGVMERLGVSYEKLAEINPKIIYAGLYGFGETGPHAERGGQDLLAQAMSGYISLQGSPDGPPQAAGVAVSDMLAGVTAAYGIMMALFVRERTGIGQKLTSNLIDPLIALQSMEVADYLNAKKPFSQKGHRGWYPQMPYGPYRAKDRAIVINFQGERLWPVFCHIMGILDLADDPRFESNEERVKHRQDLYPILDKIFVQKKAADWKALFEQNGLRCEPVYTYDDLFSDPQIDANEMVLSIEHPVAGTVRMAGFPIKLKKTPASVRRPPPLMGQHTVEILREIGYSDGQIEELEARKAINTKDVGMASDIYGTSERERQKDDAADNESAR